MVEETFEAICERMGVPENLQKHVSAQAPRKAKLAVARGLLPAPAKVLLSMQYMLLGDADASVASEAAKGLAELPEERLLGLLDRQTHPKVLEFLAYNRPEDRRLIETVVLMQQLNDKTLCFLAQTGSSRICEMIAGNQERLITTPVVYRFLHLNSNSTPALLDRVKSFHRLYGIEVAPPEEVPDDEADGEGTEASAAPPDSPPPSAEAVSAAPPQPEAVPSHSANQDPVPLQQPPEAAPWPLQASGTDGLPSDFVPGEVYIPSEPTGPYVAPSGLVNPLAPLLADWGLPDRPDWLAPPELAAAPGASLAAQASPAAGAPPTVGEADRGSLTAEGAVQLGAASEVAKSEDVDLQSIKSLGASEFKFDFKEEKTDFGVEFVDEESAADDEVKASLAKEIGKMTVGQKIKLAYKGNKTVRELLVRDTNKIVGVAVVKSGRITDREVMTIATNRSINEEVIRALTDNREFLRKYPVKVALANNPKTPIPTAISLLNSLHVKDLKNLSNNRNVSSAVFTQATRLFRARRSSS